jgi:glyoxalase family protein
MIDHFSISGIHHVTAIASGAQANFNFYTDVLGLRLVKRTVNFDSPDTYHFYYGDTAGHPGTLITFFPFEHAAPGRIGPGMADATTFAIPKDALEPWMLRFAELGYETNGPITRFAENILGVFDPDGLKIELVAEADQKPHSSSTEEFQNRIPAEHAIRRLHSISLCVEAPERTARLLTETFGYELIGEEPSHQRFRARSGGPAGIVDIQCSPELMRGRMGAGTVHHVAFRARDDAEQLKWRESILALGYNVTPVLNRQYFRSIYFREPGGALFEIATDPPGFGIDERPETLGTALKLPAWLEPRRQEIERRLPPVNFPP